MSHDPADLTLDGTPADESPATVPPPRAEAPGQAPALARLREWLTREQALDRARREPGEARRRRWLASAERSAATADEVAALWSLGRTGSERDPVAALGLYAQSAYLASLAAGWSEGQDPPPELGAAVGPSGALSPAAWAQVAEAPGDEQERLVAQAREDCRRWLDRARERCPTERLRRERRWRVLLAVLAVVVLPLLALGLALRPADLAARARWRASSAFAGYADSGRGARSARHAGALLFHTVEENSPWIDFDLGADRTIREVEVVNRSDCCSERAVPLLIEVSLDGKTWSQVARRDDGFASWQARFGPRTARHVRLRVDRRSHLHLEEVHIR